MYDALGKAATGGMAARTVDVVAHSMGGLVTRYFTSTYGPQPAGPLPVNPIHKLITIGTPHEGSPLAATLLQNQPALVSSSASVDNAACISLSVSPCTLGGLMAAQGKKVDTAISSLAPGSTQLASLANSQGQYSAIAGLAPASSVTAFGLNALISGFLPGQNLNSILGPNHDTIVPYDSELAGAADFTNVTGVVHANLCQGVAGCPDIGETQSPVIFNYIYNVLIGGSLFPSSNSPSGPDASEAQTTTAAPTPTFDLTGYTQVPATNVSFYPANNATLMINTAANITATSTTKTITEVLLYQAVSDYADIPLQFVTQSPFSIAFTPPRLGGATFAAIVLFSDMTYTSTTLTYALQTSGSPSGLTLVNAPVANMAVGDSRVVAARAAFSNGTVDVTQAAVYAVRSQTAAVFSVSAGGTITATGSGEGWLDVTYGGVTASAQIAAGSCTYSLGPANQYVPSSGGTISIQVTAASGCAWTASSAGAPWLTFTTASGTGNGIISLTARPNTSDAPLNWRPSTLTVSVLL